MRRDRPGCSGSAAETCAETCAKGSALSASAILLRPNHRSIPALRRDRIGRLARLVNRATGDDARALLVQIARRPLRLRREPQMLAARLFSSAIILSLAGRHIMQLQHHLQRLAEAAQPWTGAGESAPGALGAVILKRLSTPSPALRAAPRMGREGTIQPVAAELLRPGLIQTDHVQYRGSRYW